MTDFLDTKRKEIEDRLRELRPLVDEFKRLEQAQAALAGVGASAAGRARSTARRARGGGGGTGRRGRPRGSGQRAQQALSLVKSNPGITVAELAKKMGIAPNYLYRVLPSLQKDGKVKKQGNGWHAA